MFKLNQQLARLLVFFYFGIIEFSSAVQKSAPIDSATFNIFKYILCCSEYSLFFRQFRQFEMISIEKSCVAVRWFARFTFKASLGVATQKWGNIFSDSQYLILE